MLTTLIVLHALVAMFLLGACTHQMVGLFAQKPVSKPGFIDAYRSTNGLVFVRFICLSYVISFLLGAYLYPDYRLDARPALEEYRAFTIVGLFELKEHIAAMGLALLPLYYRSWSSPINNKISQQKRTAATMAIALSVWFTLIAGHVVNNARGL